MGMSTSCDHLRSVVTPEYSLDRKSTRLNSSHLVISYAVFCLKKKKKRLTFDRVIYVPDMSATRGSYVSPLCLVAKARLTAGTSHLESMDTHQQQTPHYIRYVT